MTKHRNRIVSGLLLAAITLGLIPTTVLAGREDDGLCDHHPAHTAACGYAPASDGSPCSHAHTEACYEFVTQCVHEHTADCYPAGQTPEQPDVPTTIPETGEALPPEAGGAAGATDTVDSAVSLADVSANAEPRSAPACTHSCTENSGCVTRTLACTHDQTHDALCGYVPATDASPCTFDCPICAGVFDEPDWVKTAQDEPDMSDLAEGEQVMQIYAAPRMALSADELASLQAQAADVGATPNPDLQIPDAELEQYITHIGFAYVNGDSYTGGPLTVTEGDNFSYNFTWAPRTTDNPNTPVKDGLMTHDSKYWGDGAWFKIKLFQIPNLTLASADGALVIGGVRVGDWKLEYNRNSGEMWYTVVFNEFIKFFNPETVMAQIRGSGSFQGTLEAVPTKIWGAGGTLTIEPRPVIPPTPSEPTGTGWKPAQPPTFDNDPIPFGKGVKWDSSGDISSGRTPEIDWRVPFFNLLQEAQEDFLNGKKPKQFNQYLIIEDTLDRNQSFYIPTHSADVKRFGDAPFHLELPVLAVGTDTILNGSIGKAEYDGPGEIRSYISGGDQGNVHSIFTEITKDDVKPGEDESIDKAIRKHVETHPLTWAVVNDPYPDRATLIINAGVPGGNDPEESLTWTGATSTGDWYEKRLKDLIQQCQTNIDNMQNGTDSPISLLDTREAALINLLQRAVNLPENENINIPEQIDAFRNDYRTWRNNPSVNPIGPLEKDSVDPDEPPEIIVPLPNIELVEQMKDWIVLKGNQKIKLQDSVEYKNYILSLKNLLADQQTYLANRTSYGRGWTEVKERYQKTLEFYKDYGIYGFVLKVRSKSDNTSMQTYENNIKISLGNKEWTADDSAKVDFGSGITGSFALGSVVLQKADAHYIPSDLKEHGYQVEHQQDVVDTIKDLQKNGGALNGVTFHVYGVSADHEGFDPDKDAISKNLAHFLPPEASENGTSYIFTHVDETHGSTVGGDIQGEVEELNVDNKTGQLSIENLFDATALRFYLLEHETPDGFYRDPRPIPITSKFDQVLYHLIPNVSRSVRLTKVDSYSNTPLAGAEFQLYQTATYDEETKDYVEQTPAKITGFEARQESGSNESGYWLKPGGSAKLLTNDNGVLCLHGLDPGKYYLQEVQAPDGYTIPDADGDGKGTKYEFKLGYDLPTDGETNPGDGVMYDYDKENNQYYDKDYHILLPSNTENVVNDPKTANLTLTKVDGTNPANTLDGAGFALFRFKGTEAEWEAGEHDNPSNWVMIDLHGDDPSEPDVPPDDKEYFKLAVGTDLVEVEINENGLHFSGYGAQTRADGTLGISNIPVGHYSIAEVIAPTANGKQYERPYTSMYFHVTGAEKDRKIQLYDNPTNSPDTKPIEGNQVKNYTQLAQLALVKYDAAEGAPTITGAAPHKDGWKYDPNFEDKLNTGNFKPLPDATYKLFMSMGGNSEPNPDPEEKGLETLLPKNEQKPQYDPCLAMGTTDDNGILRLSDMKDHDGKSLGNGLNMEYYYLVEVKAPDGYLLDQNPIRFPLLADTLPDDPDADSVPGLIKIAPNRKVDYGLQLRKIDAEMPEPEPGEQPPDLAKWGLEGAIFEVREQTADGSFGEALSFTGANGVYQLNPTPTPDDPSFPAVTSGEQGALTITGLKAGTTYQFTEIAAPQGYHKCGDGKLDDGSLCSGGDACKPLVFTLTTASAASDTTLLENGVLYPSKEPELVKNARLKGRVELYKVDAETRKALAGAKFELWKTVTEVIPEGDPDYDPDHSDATRSWDEPVQQNLLTNTDGVLRIDNLDWEDTYFLREVEAPDGYALDQSKLMFSIDRYSFNEKGEPVTVLFPAVTNSVGKLGRAKLTKVDANDKSKPLADAHFYLMKKIESTTRSLDENWVGYGQGMYITDGNGEINLLLPPGEYKLIEMKAPDGYVITGMGEVFFEIPADLPEDEVVIIDDYDPDTDPDTEKDGVVTNKQGTTGVHLTKTLLGSDIPVPGATFQIFWEEEDFLTGEIVSTKYLNFIDQGGGNYQYSKEAIPGKTTTELTTNASGEIFMMLDESFISKTRQDRDLILKSLYVQEIKAPNGLVLDSKKHLINANNFAEGIYLESDISNKLNPETLETLSININKSANMMLLEGAEFTLYYYLDTEAHEDAAHLEIAKGTTDAQGRLTFSQKDFTNALVGLEPGGVYHIVETKAPTGFVLDETHHEVVLDGSCFDKDFNFIAPTLNLRNYQVSGAVQLRKVDADDPTKGLEGAEFELLRKDENADPLQPHWEHYGEWRYRTDANGELRIDGLPYGAYELVERSAPLGYLLGEHPVTLPFTIEEDDNGKVIDLGDIKNTPDPSPRKAVTVRKVAAGDPSQGLPGAHFQLYYLGDDGEYHLRTDQVFITDENGEIHFPIVPAGSYAMNEVKAPDGYLLPEQTMTRFTVPPDTNAPDPILVQIENKRVGGEQGGGGDHGGGGGGEDKPDPDDEDKPGEDDTDTLTVRKLWVGTGSVARPDSILVQLYRNGKPYGKPVELSADNDWTHTWDSLDPDDTWSVDEVAVPVGYYKTVSRRGDVWTIFNATTPGIPVDPSDPTTPVTPIDPTDPNDPNNPTDPGTPGDPGAPGNPGGSDGSGTPGTSGTPSETGHPGQPGTPTHAGGTPDHVPQTGDPSQLPLWLGLMGLSAAGFGLVWHRHKPYKARRYRNK